jgi:hypothetical protein
MPVCIFNEPRQSFFLPKNDIFRRIRISNTKLSPFSPKFPHKVGVLNQKTYKTEFNENGDWQIGSGVDIEVYI